MISLSAATHPQKVKGLFGAWESWTRPSLRIWAVALVASHQGSRLASASHELSDLGQDVSLSETLLPHLLSGGKRISPMGLSQIGLWHLALKSSILTLASSGLWINASVSRWPVLAMKPDFMHNTRGKLIQGGYITAYVETQELKNAPAAWPARTLIEALTMQKSMNLVNIQVERNPEHTMAHGQPRLMKSENPVNLKQ